IADGSDAGDVDRAAATEDRRVHMFPEARLVMQGNLARLLVVHCRNCAGQEGGVLREVPETDLAERRGNHSVIKLFALGLEVKFVALIAPVDFYLASLILVLKPRDLAA